MIYQKSVNLAEKSDVKVASEVHKIVNTLCESPIEVLIKITEILNCINELSNNPVEIEIIINKLTNMPNEYASDSTNSKNKINISNPKNINVASITCDILTIDVKQTNLPASTNSESSLTHKSSDKIKNKVNCEKQKNKIKSSADSKLSIALKSVDKIVKKK